MLEGERTSWTDDSGQVSRACKEEYELPVKDLGKFIGGAEVGRWMWEGAWLADENWMAHLGMLYFFFYRFWTQGSYFW